MCAGALRWARIEKLVIGARDEKAGFLLTSKNILHPKTEMSVGVMDHECSTLLKTFFKAKRA